MGYCIILLILSVLASIISSEKQCDVNIKSDLWRSEKAKIFDAFSFTNEFETLIIRLYELYPVVHKFVIVEASESFTGTRRELIFEKFKNDDRILPFKDKIVYSVCDYPDQMKQQSTHAKSDLTWKREHYTRNHCIRIALKEAGFNKDSLIILGDVDEIPSRETVNYISTCQSINGKSFTPSDKHKIPRCYPLLSYQTNRLHFNFHCQSENMAQWPLPRVIYGEALKDWKVQEVRGVMRRECRDLTQVVGGWHLSNFYYNDISTLVEKYATFSHQEVTAKFQNTKKFWQDLILKGGDYITNTKCVERNTTDLPHYVLDHYTLYLPLLNAHQIQFAKSRQQQGKVKGEKVKEISLR